MGKFELLGPEAERLYIAEGKTLEQISEILQVSPKSLSDWSQKGEWPQKRAERLKNSQSAEEEVRKQLYDKLRIISSKKAEDFDTKDADKVSKLLSAIGKLDSQGDPLRATVSVMGMFTKYLRRDHAEMIAPVSEIIPGFFEYVRENNAK